MPSQKAGMRPTLPERLRGDAMPDRAFREFLAGLIDNPMQRGQPFAALVLQLCKTHGLTMTCSVLGRSL